LCGFDHRVTGPDPAKVTYPCGSGSTTLIYENVFFANLKVKTNIETIVSQNPRRFKLCKYRDDGLGAV
jgi:hypothetical protein